MKPMKIAVGATFGAVLSALLLATPGIAAAQDVKQDTQAVQQDRKQLRQDRQQRNQAASHPNQANKPGNTAPLPPARRGAATDQKAPTHRPPGVAKAPAPPPQAARA